MNVKCQKIRALAGKTLHENLDFPQFYVIFILLMSKKIYKQIIFDYNYDIILIKAAVSVNQGHFQVICGIAEGFVTLQYFFICFLKFSPSSVDLG